MTDQEIVGLFLQRNEDGIAETARQYGARLIQIAETLLSPEDAEECVNDLYLVMWNHIPPDLPEHLLSYMTAILKNLARERLRFQNAKKREADVLEMTAELSACIPDPNANTEADAILHASNILNQFLAKQTALKRKIFLLRYWYGKSIPDITQRINRSEAMVKKTLFRMRKQLEKELME